MTPPPRYRWWILFLLFFATTINYVDRIVFSSIVASAVTVWGEDLVPQVAAPSVRRLDVFKALFGFSGQAVLSVVTFPELPERSRDPPLATVRTVPFPKTTLPPPSTLSTPLTVIPPIA